MPIDPKDFVVTWEPVLPSRMQWAAVTHEPTERAFRLKCAWCVSDLWLKLPHDEAAAARDKWVRDNAVAYLTRVLYGESAEGIKAAKLAEAEAAAESAKQAADVIAKALAEYPDAKLPTVTVTAYAIVES